MSAKAQPTSAIWPRAEGMIVSASLLVAATSSLRLLPLRGKNTL